MSSPTQADRTQKITLVDQLLHLISTQVLPENVVFLLAIPIQLPLVEAKPRIVLPRRQEEVSVGDGIEDGELGFVAQGVGIGRQLCALEQNGTDRCVLLEDLLDHIDNARLHVVDVDLLTFCNRVEARNILAALDHEAGIVNVETTAGQKRLLLRLQRVIIRGENQHLVVLVESNGDHRALHHRAHETRHTGHLTCQRLERHHETTVTRDAAAAFVFQPLHGFDELLLHIRRQFARLRHLKREARNHTEENIVVVAARMIDVALGRRIVVVQAQNS
mmetsp:Transcript_126340/g.299952  ORF Transcript_126340/g.299952 Transcript_126340/m.299952 type:complete len:276 (+) Transcript_126340:56-883(+)